MKPRLSYGTTANRGLTVSYADLCWRRVLSWQRASARTSKAVPPSTRLCPPNHIPGGVPWWFWRPGGDQCRDPLALKTPPTLADAAVGQWEQALRLAQQTANYEDSAARLQLEQLRRDTDTKARSVELREKEWDMAARVRERALADAREQLNLLLKEIAIERAERRARDARIADLESQLEQHRRQLANVITRAISRNRAGAGKVHAARRPKARKSHRGKRSELPRSTQKPKGKSQLKRRRRPA